MANVLNVAKYLINQSRPGTPENITNLKLQKLLYYAQGFHLAILGRPLFEEEIQAWLHGPVVPEVYNEYKGFTYNDIKEQNDLNMEDLTIVERELLDDVWNIFKSYNGKVLEEMTHNEAPWKNARKGLDLRDYSNEIIDKESIQEYFEREYIIEGN
ncbi:Panacea domain-containing protein [Bacillus cereus group sp. BfR-BA-01350]|uniref:Panacea domain-containing protein n=1 Tax=Bacillus cereus group sp. BfR-BA-01350 TaxID=2920313 RepID=UPI001F58492C|nr:type II toxin-antitoxin system antitoxin SocA domain-containing protein [Bacillus cereus group sp. BfR-BA-01350]